jgi:uncharacterized membrane protein
MATQVTESIIVKGSREEIFRLWSDFENIPKFMKYVESIDKLDDETSRWMAKGPLNTHLEWYAQITRDDPNKRMSWKTLKGDIQTSGQVTFLDLPKNETQITVTVKIVPPIGKIGETIGTLFTDPFKRINEDLSNFKEYAEERTRRIPLPKMNK